MEEFDMASGKRDRGSDNPVTNALQDQLHGLYPEQMAAILHHHQPNERSLPAHIDFNKPIVRVNGKVVG